MTTIKTKLARVDADHKANAEKVKASHDRVLPRSRRVRLPLSTIAFPLKSNELGDLLVTLEDDIDKTRVCFNNDMWAALLEVLKTVKETSSRLELVEVRVVSILRRMSGKEG